MNRGHNVTNKVSYSYQLCSLTSEPTALGAGFQSMSTAFRHTRVEDYNWNYLDQHICGHSDFEELGEVRKGSIFPSIPKACRPNKTSVQNSL